MSRIEELTAALREEINALARGDEYGKNQKNLYLDAETLAKLEMLRLLHGSYGTVVAVAIEHLYRMDIEEQLPLKAALDDLRTWLREHLGTETMPVRVEFQWSPDQNFYAVPEWTVVRTTDMEWTEHRVEGELLDVYGSGPDYLVLATEDVFNASGGGYRERT